MSATSEAIERMERRADWIKFDATNNIDAAEMNGKAGPEMRRQLRNIKKLMAETAKVIEGLDD